VDFAAGMADALIAKFVAELGATVRRIPPERGDPFVDVYPAYRMWQCGQLIEGAARGSAREQSLLREADICIIGGEDYPGMMLRHDAEDLLVEFPRLVILHITASNDLHPGRSLPAVDILAQARSGVVFELAESEPMLMSFQPANYGVSLQSLTGLGAALFARESTGQGQIVSVNFGSMCLGRGREVQSRIRVRAAQRCRANYLLLPRRNLRPHSARCLRFESQTLQSTWYKRSYGGGW
jgi:hypothetical protein